MPRIRYIERKFSAASLAIIEKANEIIDAYEAQGFDLTLRQLYYQFVSRDLIPNSDREYKRLGSVINDARLAGLIDWDRITDRTRNVRMNSHWSDPRQIMRSAARSYAIDKWATQEYRPEVWIEKDALVGVISKVCGELDIPYFSCRGYTSQSEMWAASQRLLGYLEKNQIPIIFHLGDHDPSGKDMTRDIEDRLELFMGGLEVDRLALNMDQIDEYQPPPNPAKITDSRASAYIAQFGNQSWELDALEPTVLSDLIESAVLQYRDESAWEAALDEERDSIELLEKAAGRWGEVTALLNGQSS
jgi:hypothetical protein